MNIEKVQLHQQEQHLTDLQNTNEDINLQVDVQPQLIGAQKDSNISDLRKVVHNHLDVFNGVNNLLHNEKNGMDWDKGKNAYPEGENEQVDKGGDKTQSKQQLVQKKMEIEGFTKPLPHPIIA